MQRQRAPAVEQIDIAFLGRQESPLAEFVDQFEKTALLAGRDDRRGADDVGDLRQRLPHILGRIGEQGAEGSEHAA